MANEFKIISEDGLKTLCKAIKKVSNIGEIIDDDNSVTDKTYSSFEIDRRLNTKVDKTQLTAVLDETVTNEQIPSAKAVYDGLENINDFNVQVVKEKLDLNDITETGIYFFPQAYTPVNIPAGVNGWLLVMKGNSSDIVKQVWYRQGSANVNSYNTFERYKAGNTWGEWTKFLTEKEYYNALDYGNPNIPQDADLNDYLTPGVYTCMSSEIANTLTNCPHISSNFKLIVNKNRGTSDKFYGYQMIVGTVGGNPVTDVRVYYRGISMYDDACVFSKWKIMSGSTVADVSKTTIIFSDETNYKPHYTNGQNMCYEVKNGVCYVSYDIDTVFPTATGAFITINKLPISNLGYIHSYTFAYNNELTKKPLMIRLGTDGSLAICSGETGSRYLGSFSYPVAE